MAKDVKVTDQKARDDKDPNVAAVAAIELSSNATDPNGEVKSGVYRVQSKKSALSGTLTIMDTNDPRYPEAVKYKTKKRDIHLNNLLPEEKELILKANEQGKGVQWKGKNGNHVFTFVPNEKQKEKAAAKAKGAEQAEEEKKGGFWARNGWLKWTLGALGVIGAGLGLYFLLKPKKDKKPAAKSVTPDKPNTPDTPNTPSEPKDQTPAVPQQSGQEVSAPAIINPGDELGQGPVGMEVNSGLTVAPGLGTGSSNVETGEVNSGLTSDFGKGGLSLALDAAGTRVNVGTVSSGLQVEGRDY